MTVPDRTNVCQCRCEHQCRDGSAAALWLSGSHPTRKATTRMRTTSHEAWIGWCTLSRWNPDYLLLRREWQPSSEQAPAR